MRHERTIIKDSEVQISDDVLCHEEREERPVPENGQALVRMPASDAELPELVVQGHALGIVLSVQRQWEARLQEWGTAGRMRGPC